MRFLEYIFFKYYNWAIKVGDGDCPATTSVICISFCISLWFMDAVMTWCFFISPMSSFGVTYGFVFPSVFVVSFLVLYIVLVAKGKEQTINFLIPPQRRSLRCETFSELRGCQGNMRSKRGQNHVLPMNTVTEQHMLILTLLLEVMCLETVETY